MTELDPYLAIFEKLAAVGFPTLLLFVIFGSYAGVWEWGKTARLREAELLTRILAVEAACLKREDALQKRVDELFGMMISAANVVERSARAITKRRDE